MYGSSWGSWRPLGSFCSCDTKTLSSYKDIAVVRHAKHSPWPGTNQVPAAVIMKFASCPGRCPGFSPHSNMALALPFDPSLGVADPNDAAALPGIALDADAALARTNHATAGSRIPKHASAVRR